MASPKPRSRSTVSEESSVVQVLNSSEPLVASPSSGPSCVQVLDSSEPLVPVMPSSSEPEAGCSRTAAVTASSSASPTWTEGSPSDGEPRPSGSSDRRTHFNVEEIRSHWNMVKRLDRIPRCIQFAEECNLIPKEKMCNYHRRPMALSSSGKAGQLGSFCCMKGNCRDNSESRAKGTWFEHVQLPLDIMLQIMYMFSHSYTYLQVQVETAREDRETVLSTSTIADWFSYCREAVVVCELEHQEAHGQIGGPGKIVEIDESKFGKGKGNIIEEDNHAQHPVALN